METTREKMGRMFKDYIIEAVISLACLAYVLIGIAQIVKTGKTVPEIIASGIMAFVFGFAICRLFAMKGMIVGEKDARFRGTLLEFGKEVERTIPNINKLAKYCEAVNEVEQIKYQTHILASAGLEYGVFIKCGYDLKKLTKLERRAVNKAATAKVHKLSVHELLSESGEYHPDGSLGKTKEQFMKSSSIKDIVSRILIAFVFGYFGVSFVGGFSLAGLIWSIVQVIFFLVSGVLKYVISFNFITEEFRDRIIQKMTILEQFNNNCENNKQIKEEETNGNN